MERGKHQMEILESLARQTAQEVGCEALRWWQDKRDPRRLLIKALCPLGTERSLVVKLEAIMPKQTEPCLPGLRKELNSPAKRPFRLSLLQRS